MTKVTYRGVEYNAEEYNAKVVAEATKRNRHDLMSVSYTHLTLPTTR